ncbi:MAG: hypothetical protein U9Q29_06725 [Campylobacterota bacterium]|nr:hypothetical protein [Campylobacterota bacterium]
MPYFQPLHAKDSKVPAHKEPQLQKLKKRVNVRRKFAVALIVLQEFLTKQ